MFTQSDHKELSSMGITLADRAKVKPLDAAPTLTFSASTFRVDELPEELFSAHGVSVGTYNQLVHLSNFFRSMSERDCDARVNAEGIATVANECRVAAENRLIAFTLGGVSVGILIAFVAMFALHQ